MVLHGYDTHDRYLKPAPYGYAFTSPDEKGLGAELARQVGGVSQVVDHHYEPSVDTLEQFVVEKPRFDRGSGILKRDPEAPLLSDADRNHIAAVYDGAVAWMDASLGLFLGDLEREGILANTTMVVLSDHGEELGEKGVFHHRYSLEEAVTHVPLMIRLPEKTAKRVSGLVQLIDVAPTLWDLAGIRTLTPVEGHSLRTVLAGSEDTGNPMVFFEGALQMAGVRTLRTQLFWEGFRRENPWSARTLLVAPVNGIALKVEGDFSETEPLRSALHQFLATP